MAKPEKVAEVERIKAEYASIAQGGSVVFASYEGMKVEELFKLRRALREKSVTLRVLKNTLVRRALQESGVNGVEDYLRGTTAVAFSPDEVSAAKVLAAFIKEVEAAKQEPKLVIKGGVLEGKAVTAKEVAHLASLPGREELMGKLLGLLQAPASALLRLIQEPSARMARLAQAIGEKNK